MTLRGTLTHVLPIEESSQVGHARRVAQRLAEQLRFNETDAGRVALVVTELASNLIKHAGRGELHIRETAGVGAIGVEVIAIDRGPGFDPHSCLQDGYSTQGSQGIGLGAIQRQADVFDVHACPKGAALLVRFYPSGDAVRDLRLGASQHALQNETVCGDAWSIAYEGSRVSLVMIDGLGHGPAAEAASLAGLEAFSQAPHRDPTLILERMHEQMRGSRGGAVAIAEFDGDSGILRFVGVGNISASLISAERSRGIASHPGIVGLQFRKPQVQDYPDAAHLLVMHSDGLQSRWNLQDYPGLVNRHPALVAAVLHRDYCRGRDDATVVVLDLEAFHG